MATRVPTEIEALTWTDFLQRQRDHWEPGEHWGLCGTTGAGKTTFLAGLAKTRRFVLALDQKGGDKTLTALGWDRMTNWPPSRRDRRDMADRLPYRRIVGDLKRDKLARARRRDLHRQILEAVMEEGGWTVLAPDLGALTSRALGNAWDEVIELLVLLRDSNGSFVTDFHALRRIPPEAPENVTYLGISYTRDKDLVTDLARSMGRSTAEIHGAVEALGPTPYTWLVVSRNPRDPIILTRPEKLS